MSIKDEKFPSSAAFDLMKAALEDQKERDAAIKQAKAVFAFQLKNKQGESKSWYIDLKNKGEVGQGAGPAGGKADVTLILSDADFQKLSDGKANAQQMFMSGKLKITGNMMKATKLEPILKKGQAKAKL